MNSMHDLLESMNKFAGEKVGQRPGDQVRGEESVPKKGGYKKHPYVGRLVGGATENTKNILKDLNQVINENSKQRNLFDEWEKFKKSTIVEYGAPGSGIGNDTATNPAEVFARGQEQKANRDNIRGQVSDLVAQLQGARAELAGLNKQFPQGANPVEKAMSLQQMSGQKIGIKKSIENLSAQIAALRQQAI